MNILVTGANGHLGATIVRQLLERGYNVIPFVRRTSNLSGLAGLDLDYRYGDIMDADSVHAAAAGCDVIIHTAAVYRFWAKNPDDIIQPALQGTRNIIAAAEAAGARRLIYTSTTFAVGATADPGRPLNADNWNDDRRTPYTITKAESEKMAWHLAAAAGVPLIVFCPDGIMGPHDYNITTTTALLRSWLNGDGVVSRGGGSFVDVRDVADVHVQAVTRGEPGQRYIVAGERLTMYQWADIVTRLTGIKPRRLGAGRGALWFMGGLMELGARLTGAAPAMTRAMARELVDRYHYYDCAKTAQAFDFKPRPAETMLADSIRWLLHRGEIKPGVAAEITRRLPADPRWPVVAAVA